MTLEQLPAGDDQATALTIERMSQYAREDSSSEIVRRAAHEAAALAPLSPADGVFWWIRNHVRFVADAEVAQLAGIPDAADAEVLIRPIDLLTMPEPAGDCDDFSTLCASMLRALGIESSFRTVAADPADPAHFSHVYVIAHLPSGDQALDCSHGKEPGWEVHTAAGKVKTWPIEAPMKITAAPLGKLSGDDSEWWQDLIKTGVETAGSIAKTVTLPKGYYQQTGANGQVTYVQQPGAAALQFPSTFGTSSSTTWLFMGIGLLALVLVISAGGRNR